MPELQLEEEGQPDSALLVDCPGCPQCEATGGYITRLSAGRPTKSHEYVFLLTKKATYYYDSEAIAEPVTATPRGSGRPWIEQSEGIVLGRATNPNGGLLSREPSADGMRNKRSVWTVAPQQVTLRHDLTDEQRSYVVAELLRRGLL